MIVQYFRPVVNLNILFFTCETCHRTVILRSYSEVFRQHESGSQGNEARIFQ